MRFTRDQIDSQWVILSNDRCSTRTRSGDIEGGSETVELDFPFVLSASKGLAEQAVVPRAGGNSASSLNCGYDSEGSEESLVI